MTTLDRVSTETERAMVKAEAVERAIVGMPCGKHPGKCHECRAEGGAAGKGGEGTGRAGGAEEGEEG